MKNLYLQIIPLALISVTVQTYAQTGDVGIGTNTPQAKLHVNGDLRIDTLKTVANPDSVLVIDPTTKKIAKTTYPVVIGDVKQGFQTADHNGWIKLDGRAITTLTTTQQTAATALGFATNLPDATDAFLVQNANVLGNVSSSNSKTIAQTNLPNVNFTGTSGTAGAHTHELFLGVKQPTPNQGRWAFKWSDVGTTGGLSTFSQLAGGLQSFMQIQSGGDHTHSLSVSSGGSGTALDITPQSLSVNTFVYLGD